MDRITEHKLNTHILESRFDWWQEARPSPLQSSQTASGAQSASWVTGTFQGGRAVGAWSWG